jgi:type VI protein secretion system component VasK
MSNELSDFEKQLAKAMRRVDAPPNVAKFLALATEVHAERELPRRERKHRWAFFLPMPPSWAAGALAAVLVLGVFAGEQVHERRQQARAEQQFETAMRVTDHALDQTRAQLERVGLNLGE